MDHVIADVTKSYPGTVGKVLGKIRRVMDAPAVTVTVLLYEDQVPELETSGFDVQGMMVRTISRTASIPEVALQMALEAATKYSATVFFSHHGQVLGLFVRMDPESRRRVSFYPWGKALDYLDQATPARITVATFGTPITDLEAFSVIKTALTAKNATSRERAIHQTSFRDLLARVDPRFLKANPTTNVPSYISALLQRAVRAGVVHVEPHINNPMIWLAGQQDLSGAPTVPPARLPETAGNVTAVAVSDAASVERAANTRPEDTYLDILRTSNMGPFPNLRDDLYDALEGRAGLKTLTLNKLISACLTKAQEAHMEPKDAKIPWRTTVRAFLINMLTRRPVLRDGDGNYVAPSLPTGQTIIQSIDPQFRLMLDGALVTLLLEKGAEIRFEDTGSLVGALYLTRESKFHDLLDDVFVYLKGAGEIQYIGGEVKLAPKVIDTVTALSPRRA